VICSTSAAGLIACSGEGWGGTKTQALLVRFAVSERYRLIGQKYAQRSSG
jgi:hypothetical protein